MLHTCTTAMHLDRMCELCCWKPELTAGSHDVSDHTPCPAAGDRLYTSWLRLLGGSAPAVPMVELTLTRMGNDIKSVSASVGPRCCAACHRSFACHTVCRQLMEAD